MKIESNLYVAKTLRMMNWICKKFDCIRVSDDIYNPNRKVFIFEDSEELRRWIAKYPHKEKSIKKEYDNNDRRQFKKGTKK